MEAGFSLRQWLFSAREPDDADNFQEQFAELQDKLFRHFDRVPFEDRTELDRLKEDVLRFLEDANYDEYPAYDGRFARLRHELFRDYDREDFEDKDESARMLDDLRRFLERERSYDRRRFPRKV
ncbi:unnamed protein product [Haemonchus placei]|uniref:VWA domain-containing protein n=1 Tax=Haemonchus placei TaxID=6290 RepID=A0A0N4WVM2_HAEPC|nr:unnamed protein product [Haemonchus placei]